MKKKRKINVVVIKEGIGYSATSTIDNRFMATEAETFEELKAGMLEVLNFTFEEVDFEFTLNDIRFEFDLEIGRAHV